MVQASRRKFHYIYKITRVDNGRYYIGMHSTDNLEDGYFGSGKLITASVKKHGREKHTKEILEYCESRESLKAREKELVNHLLLEDKMCMNLTLGGGCGWEIVNLKKQNLYGTNGANFAKTGVNHPGNPKLADLLKDRGDYQLWRDRISSGVKKTIAENGFWWSGRQHTAEAKSKMSDIYAASQHQSGSKNSQYGMIWIHNSSLQQCRKIKENEALPSGWVKGRKMYK